MSVDIDSVIESVFLNKLTLLPFGTLQNICHCITSTIKNGVPGDFIETGVWQGGACIYAWQLYKSLVVERKVFVADSFEGLPKPNVEKYPEDAGDNHWTIDNLKVSLETVKSNFEKYGKLDDSVVFLKGWFKDTLPTAPIDKIAVLRLDGDMYESTIDSLTNLYPKLSKGGYCIIDDYGHKGAKAAVDYYRKSNNITDEIILIDPTPGAYPSIYWKRINKNDLVMSKMKRPVSEERWIGGVKEVRTFIDNIEGVPTGKLEKNK